MCIKLTLAGSIFALFSLFFSCNLVNADGKPQREHGKASAVPLALPNYHGQFSLEEAIYNRKAIRKFRNKAINLSEVSQLLWAGGGKTIDGITGATRSYPAAGGLYPLNFYLITEKVDSLESGIYRYNWKEHSLIQIKSGNFIKALKNTTYSSSFKSATAPACIVVTALYSVTVSKYGDRGNKRYVCMAMGGSGQNIHLQAEAIGLGTFIIGAFVDDKVKQVLGIESSNEEPLYIMPIGKK